MTLKFKLEVYSSQLKGFLMSENRRGLELFLTGNRVLGKTHEQMVKEGWINSSWLYFIIWYNEKEWSLFRKKMVFRGIIEYSWVALLRIMRKGTDRIADENSANFNFAQEAMKKHYNLGPEDFVWAADLQLAWKTANDKIGPFNDGKRLILIYDKRLLENVEYGGYVFKLKKGISSFKQALAAVVIIDFR